MKSLLSSGIQSFFANTDVLASSKQFIAAQITVSFDNVDFIACPRSPVTAKDVKNFEQITEQDDFMAIQANGLVILALEINAGARQLAPIQAQTIEITIIKGQPIV